MNPITPVEAMTYNYTETVIVPDFVFYGINMLIKANIQHGRINVYKHDIAEHICAAGGVDDISTETLELWIAGAIKQYEAAGWNIESKALCHTS